MEFSRKFLTEFNGNFREILFRRKIIMEFHGILPKFRNSVRRTPSLLEFHRIYLTE